MEGAAAAAQKQGGLKTETYGPTEPDAVKANVREGGPSFNPFGQYPS